MKRYAIIVIDTKNNTAKLYRYYDNLAVAKSALEDYKLLTDMVNNLYNSKLCVGIMEVEI